MDVTVEGVDRVGQQDAQLWDAARAGDSEAFGRLFDRYASAVYNYCAHRIGTYEAEDLAAKVFLEAWRCRGRLALTTPSLLPLLFGIAANVCARHQRSLHRRLRALTRLPVPAHERDIADDVAAAVDSRHALAAVARALRALPREQREVVELCLIGGLDTKTAAAALSVPEGTVKSRLSRARAELRAHLAPKLTEDVKHRD